MRILYSFNKLGYEGEQWATEIQRASDSQHSFVAFNHQKYLDPNLYTDAAKLDRLYRQKHPGLMRMYSELRSVIEGASIDALLVANCPPYHPDFLRTIRIYKALYSADDPDATYMINIPYLHAYQHVFFVDPAYSADMDMLEKMRYAGMINANLLPISVFDFEHDVSKTEDRLFSQHRDIDIVYIGGFWRQKVSTILKVAKTFGNSFRLHGFFRLKHNLYLNIVHGAKRWVRPVSFQQRVALYQRAKIGFNIHWNEFGLGNQRLYHLPANGVMQISDCPAYLDAIFKNGEEIIGYTDPEDLIAKLRYFLKNDQERIEIARHGYRRTMQEYRFRSVTQRAASLMKEGMYRINWASAVHNTSNKGPLCAE